MDVLGVSGIKSEADGVDWRSSALITGDGLPIHTRNLRNADPAERK